MLRLIRMITNIGAITNIGSRVSTKNLYADSHVQNATTHNRFHLTIQSVTRACPTEERRQSRGPNPTARSPSALVSESACQATLVLADTRLLRAGGLVPFLGHARADHAIHLHGRSSLSLSLSWRAYAHPPNPRACYMSAQADSKGEWQLPTKRSRKRSRRSSVKRCVRVCMVCVQSARLRANARGWVSIASCLPCLAINRQVLPRRTRPAGGSG